MQVTCRQKLLNMKCAGPLAVDHTAQRRRPLLESVQSITKANLLFHHLHFNTCQCFKLSRVSFIWRFMFITRNAAMFWCRRNGKKVCLFICMHLCNYNVISLCNYINVIKTNCLWRWLRPKHEPINRCFRKHVNI